MRIEVKYEVTEQQADFRPQTETQKYICVVCD